MAERKFTRADAQFAKEFLAKVEGLAHEPRPPDLSFLQGNPVARVIVRRLIRRYRGVLMKNQGDEMFRRLSATPTSRKEEKKNRQLKFLAEYNRLRIGRTHNAAVLMAAENLGIKERTAWNYVGELGIGKNPKEAPPKTCPGCANLLAGEAAKCSECGFKYPQETARALPKKSRK